MAKELYIPKLGQTVEEVTLINWLVKDGDKVEQGQEVLEVETDKAVFNVEATDDGYIHMGPFKVGEVVPILTVVAIIGEKDEVFTAPKPSGETDAQKAPAPTETDTTTAEKPASTTQSTKSEKPFASPRARKLAEEKGVDLSAVTPTGNNGQRVQESDVLKYLSQSAKASPVAKRMAADAGLDLNKLQGSGTRGEITKADVENAMKKPEKPAAATVSIPLPPMEVSKQIPLKGVRGVIADRMGTSAHTTAQVTLFTEVDATDFVALREKLKAKYENKWGFAPGYNDLLAKACSSALRRFPYLNARVNGDIIEELAHVNIGIAVDSKRGLYVPVIRDVDQKDLKAVGSEFRKYIEEVRSGKILPENISGGTFTITNLGIYQIEGFTPIINLPEAAILGVGQIAPKAVVVNDMIVIRKMMVLSLTFDHRIADGAPAAKFLQYLKELIESPSEVTLTK